VSSWRKHRKKSYTESAEDAEGTEKRKERSGDTGVTVWAWGLIEERFLAAQADPFAGANRFRKIGLLRSE
jgi:hypothetical protein